MNGDVLGSVRMSGFADASLGDDPGSRAARVGTIVLVNGSIALRLARFLFHFFEVISE